MKNLKAFMCLLVAASAFPNYSLYAQTLYTQAGTDVPFAQLINENILPVGFNSTLGVKGSRIDVSNNVVEVGAYSKMGIAQAINIHTVGNSSVSRLDFHVGRDGIRKTEILR